MTPEQAHELAVARGQFRARLLDLAECQGRPGAFTIVESHLIENALVGYESPASIFETLYGDETGRAFWEAECSEPMSFLTAVRLLAACRDFSLDTFPLQLRAQLDATELAINSAVLIGYQSHPDGRKIFMDDSLDFQNLKYGRQIPGDTKVNLAMIARVLLSMPKRRHLVPKSLLQYVSKSDASSVVPQLVDASDAEIRSVLQAIYRDAPPYAPPNLVTGYRDAVPRLKALGMRATKTRIEKIADEDEFRLQRRKPGAQSGPKRRR